MSFLIEAFEPAFMQRALIGSLIAVIATSLVGTWIVLRGLAFLGDALAHGVIPGVALAVLWGFNPALGAFVSALVMSGLVTFVSNRTPVRDDTAIGLLFVGMLALGVVIVSKAGSFKTDVTAILFGDALGITRADIQNQVIYTSIVVVLTVLLYRPFLALTFNQMKAHTLGMRPRLSQAALLGLLSLSIVASFQSIGTLLVFGLLVAPPATASLLVKRVPLIMAVSILLGSLAVVVGLLISFHYGTAGGATMAGISVLLFFIALIGHTSVNFLRTQRT
ncbi:MAG: zinc ABC transporter permease AztB [Actinomycetota bacterium]|nr:zinc ABC transporter permease AztB [Actinomycetota bacterium]|tara:strand:- start:994 stop:1827 length:834 start_codon:yes stop_codon:yes gene_type:complete